jgi:hypothetical protein
MMIGIGMPKSQSRIGIVWCSLPCARNETVLVPGAITELAPFDGGEAGGEGPEKQRGRHPECKLGGAASDSIGGSFCFYDDIVDPFLRLGLGHPSLRGDEARNVAFVSICKIPVLSEA